MILFHLCCLQALGTSSSYGDVKLCDCVASGGADGSVVIVDASTGTLVQAQQVGGQEAEGRCHFQFFMPTSAFPYVYNCNCNAATCPFLQTYYV
jgi:hypothetical protein